ncbi:MAG: hypothetical protein BAJALOKI2v1_140026 [Promethearchaeota archaeon]|nr:MAG: hypothetical protein BAJALOKI2v1_140026 [Candidatus Lokiarchaeota archaeon]
MDIKEFISENKVFLKKLVYLGLVVLLLSFWVFYNIFRINIGFEVYPSWGYGILTALGFTAGLLTLIYFLVEYREVISEKTSKIIKR